MGIFDNLFGRRKSNKDENNLPESSNLKTVSYNSNTIASMENYTFPEDTIMTFDGEVLDVNSSENIAKFKHNLKILMAQAKQKGKIDNFYLIREDDLFPTNWEWNVSSDQTTLEPIVTELSFQIRKTYALEQAGLTLHSQVGGFAIPGIEPTDEEQREALSKVDKRLITSSDNPKLTSNSSLEFPTIDVLSLISFLSLDFLVSTLKYNFFISLKFPIKSITKGGSTLSSDPSLFFFTANALPNC